MHRLVILREFTILRELTADKQEPEDADGGRQRGRLLRSAGGSFLNCLSPFSGAEDQ